jgi:viologen exporter family transport system permease protein
MRRLLDAYRATFRTEIAVQFAYRGALAIWLLGLLIQPVIQLAVWVTVARSQGGEVGGFTASDFAAYFVVLMVVNQLTFTWQFTEFEWRIRQGYFSPLLLRPIHPVHQDVAQNFTFKLLTFTAVVPVAVVLILAFEARIPLEPWTIVAFPATLIPAMALRFIVEWVVALIAFWVTRMGAVIQTWWIVTLFLSGQIAPLAFFPPLVQLAANILPFRWMVAFPVETLLGRLTPAEVVTGIAVQVIWIGIALVLLRYGWRAGVRRYSAVGA